MSPPRHHLLTPLAMLLVITFGSLSILSIEAQFAEEVQQNHCASKLTCHECIQAQSCAWCKLPDQYDKSRCFQPTSSYSNTCPEEFIFNPDSVQYITDHRELKRKDGSVGGPRSYDFDSSFASYSRASSAGRKDEAVQISPQRVKLQLRVNEVHSLDLRYLQAADYPLDVYYLMDLSRSMIGEKEKLSNLADLLSASLPNITSDFRLGFGSFVGKVLTPYNSTMPKELDRPCDDCETPYVYRNHMPLSRDTSTFTSEVKRAAVSESSDRAAGGLDAILQAIVCHGEVGWREQARRLLVLSTNAGFHFAGDGKLGGVISPNDGECHLNSEGLYTHSRKQDYPSIAQINQKVLQYSINIIFAVTPEQISVYDELSRNVEGSSRAILSEDSSNVIDLIQNHYNKISSTIEMKDNATSNVKITYSSACLSGGPAKPTAKCEGLKAGNVVSFTVQIFVTSCPTDPRDWNHVIQIYPVGIMESLIIDLEMICSCPCEHPGGPGFVPRAPQCHNHGTYKCGICECDEMYFGDQCECYASYTDNYDFGCRADNTTNVDCNGLGICVCGVCDCKKRPSPDEYISGKYCECDNFSCERNNNLICSGPDNGYCDCGTCACKPGWTGAACDCRASSDTCMPPSGDAICSGHGVCECGHCKCRSTDDGRFSGKYCERCPTCSGRCHEFKDCVQCQMYKTGPLKNAYDCEKNCSLTPISTGIITTNEDMDEHLCIFYDEDDCKFSFKYSEVDDDEVKVIAQQDRECPSMFSFLAMAPTNVAFAKPNLNFKLLQIIIIIKLFFV